MPPGKVPADASVGCRALDLIDATQGARIPLWLLYPTSAPAQIERFGPYPLEVARDAPVAGSELPLVLVSHGNNSTPWLFRDLAAHLARAGYAVALPMHPGNNRDDQSLTNTRANMENRPRHLRLVADAVRGDAEVAPHLKQGGHAIIGHSIGGYSALAAAGGQPSSLPHENPDGKAAPIEVVADPRVCALVLLAPAVPWFGAAGSLAAVDVPILLRMGALDTPCPPLFADIIKRGVRDPSKIDHVAVAGAGHFAFASPFPPEMVRPDFPPSQDPPGFDRAAYQVVLRAEVSAFLGAHL